MHTADTAITALERLAADLLARLEGLRAAAALPEHTRLHRASDIADDAASGLAEITRNIPLI
jgi:hypothetical protein